MSGQLILPLLLIRCRRPPRIARSAPACVPDPNSFRQPFPAGMHPARADPAAGSLHLRRLSTDSARPASAGAIADTPPGTPTSTSSALPPASHRHPDRHPRRPPEGSAPRHSRRKAPEFRREAPKFSDFRVQTAEFFLYLWFETKHTMSQNIYRIGIAQGDPNGIGWEVILKALADARITELCTPVVYGSPDAAARYAATLADTEAIDFHPIVSAHEARRGRVNLVPCGTIGSVEPGKATPEAGRAAVEALRTAVRDLKEGHLDALVTAPFDKETVQSDDFRFTGHTEYFGAEFEGDPMMILCSDRLRVGLVTKHIPVAQIAASITREKIVADLHALRRTLKQDFGIVEPRIAVLALNPHAGDGGLLGREEQEIIRPAIVEAYEAGVLAFGPFAADGLFAGGGYARYDGILAMYHDQGLAPFKTLSPDGVNFTAGLSAIRTSPDHGTAFDIAGKDRADAQSMRNAIYAACDIATRRRAWAAWTAHPLPRAEREKSRRDVSVRELPQSE